jgi:hypothetical protein
MSQFPIPGDPHAPLQQARTSGLAIGSLICSLICLCPVTTILGILLGLGALGSISGNPMRKGKGLAIAGILLGVIFTAGQAFFGYGMYKAYGIFSDAPYQALQPGFAGNMSAFKANFGSSGTAVSDERAQAFIDELRDRYGNLQSSKMNIAAFQGMQQSPGQPVQTMPWLLNFDQAAVSVELTFDQNDQVPGAKKIIFSEIRVIDTDQGDMIFPPPPFGGAEP